MEIGTIHTRRQENLSVLMKVGDLVKWYELYADAIVKDAGRGLIMDVRDVNYHNGCYRNKVYKVYRFKHNDIQSFVDTYVEPLEFNDESR